MRMGHVEVVVRLADDLVDVVELPAGSTYWLGMTAIPAVAGTARTVGLVTVTVEATKAGTHVPRPALEVRPYVYGALSLAAQLALLIVAFATAKDEPLSAPAVEATGDRHPGAVHIKRFAMPAQTIARTPDPAPLETPVTADNTPEHTAETDTPAPPKVNDFQPDEMTGGGLLPEAPKTGDGTSKFDPDQNPAFDTIRTGAYSTLATGRAAGDGYGPEARNSSLVVITCDRMSCLVVGGPKAVRVRKAVNERITELTDCYKRAAANGGGKVEIDFQVDGDGSVDDMQLEDSDPAGACVARILKTLQIDDATNTADDTSPT